jgi:hypothetical protein
MIVIKDFIIRSITLDNHKVNHIFHVDNLELYASSEEQMHQLSHNL